LSEEYKYKTIIGKHPKMKEVFELMEKVAKTDATILIYGETGTGKELVARTIHTMSFRSDKPFVPIDCMMLTESLLESELFGHVKGSFTGAIITKPGLLELANRGTLFFDEIGNLNLNIQSKLLRVIQEREFIPVGGTEKKKIDVRIIAATNRNLQDMIKGGMFREDLFYRLHIIPIYLPPLRERKSDIPLLVNYFMNEYSEKIGKKFDKIAPEAMKFFTEYEWVGNVRELENIIERLTIIHDGDSIFVEHIPHTFSSFETSLTSTIPQTNEELKEIKRIAKEKVVQEIEKKFLIAALKRNNWNISKAALETGMQRENFHTLMRKNNIKLREFQ
jgi:transcriptional regulator with PAS, ATPase and Fis domain